MPDVNVLVHAHREESAKHDAYERWLDALVNGDQAFGLSGLVLSGFLRVVTHPRIFNPPTPVDVAQAFASTLAAAPQRVAIEPGPRHWDIFVRLCRECDARGNLVADAYLAALAIESGCEFVTDDRDFARFGGLRLRHL
jgi:hypothetical protein